MTSSDETPWGRAGLASDRVDLRAVRDSCRHMGCQEIRAQLGLDGARIGRHRPRALIYEYVSRNHD